METSEESISEGVEYCGMVKKNQKVFLLAIFEKLKIVSGRVLYCYCEYSKSYW